MLVCESGALDTYDMIQDDPLSLFGEHNSIVCVLKSARGVLFSRSFHLTVSNERVEREGDRKIRERITPHVLIC